MSTFTWKATEFMLSMSAYHTAMMTLHNGKSPNITVEAFKAFKVNGLWVVTITYK